MSASNHVPLPRRFQLTAARRRLPRPLRKQRQPSVCFNSQPLEGGCPPVSRWRSKARCFNSQPLEGGCLRGTAADKFGAEFQLTAARRRLRRARRRVAYPFRVSTHSRSKAAAKLPDHLRGLGIVSTHSRSKAAARCCRSAVRRCSRFNSQPLEGGCGYNPDVDGDADGVSTHSRSKAAAQHPGVTPSCLSFQLTAARRRLHDRAHHRPHRQTVVSTHSRSKAAALCIKICEKSVNYQ